MKKEIIAAVILAVLIGFSSFNIGYVDRRMEALKAEVDSIAELSREGQHEQALQRLLQSSAEWEGFTGYAGVMLRHSDEISKVTNSYFELQQTLERGDKLPRAMCEKLKHDLSDIAKTESLSLSSLF